MSLSEQEIIRRKAKEELEKLGIDPYPADLYQVTHHATDIVGNYLELEGKNVTLAGRIMTRRIMGSASFAEIQELLSFRN